MVCYAEPVIVNEGVLLWITVINAEAVDVNHGVLYWASGCESWCVFLSQWLLIMVYIAVQVTLNLGEFYCTSDY